MSVDDGTPEPIHADDLLRVRGGGGICAGRVDHCVSRLAGFTSSAAVATVEVERLDGRVVTLVPEDRSGRFGDARFFAVDVIVPAVLSDHVVSWTPSVIARDAAGAVVAVIVEP